MQRQGTRQAVDDPFLTPPRDTRPARTGSRYKSAAPAKKAAVPGAFTLLVTLICSLPLGLFILVSFTFAVFWQATGISLAVSVLASLLAYSPGGFGAASAPSRLPPVSGMLAIVSGALTGLYAHEGYVGPFLVVALGRNYGNVLASSPAAAYADAGKIHFADTSAVDSSRAVGYRDRQTFCVAPIIDAGSSQGSTVGFWAIGLDCCGARGEFECGAASSDGSHGGLRVDPGGILERSGENFLRAIEQAAAVYDLKIEDDPIMVRWVEDPTAEQTNALLSALGVLLLGTASFVLLVFAAAAASALAGEERNGALPY